MSRARTPLIAASDVEAAFEGWPRLVLPAVGGVLVAVAVLAAVAASSPSTWQLLGAGRGLIPEEYYALWGSFLTLATMLGLLIGWVGATAVLYHGGTLIGLPRGWWTMRLAATLAYLGALVLPVLLYHVAFGGWLLGMARPELGEWLALNHPDAWLLGTGHAAVELALVPLAAVFLIFLWRGTDRLLRSPFLQGGVWLVLALSALAVALSLTIHATLAHLRLS